MAQIAHGRTTTRTHRSAHSRFAHACAHTRREHVQQSEQRRVGTHAQGHPDVHIPRANALKKVSTTYVHCLHLRQGEVLLAVVEV
eukprot:CAMPEP_0183350496 /NCGR_PEP_ID=MMETSP0164_2-20130417/19457_1 /TAXON_ID=221442 /ORGANISM="Coccolithus pelagicus ssp braarudi, Strain PLY182g" /LENGTH=84 /DNA_ID=CAMNT_0025522429 /DNA_START=382 /DNA_END=636 /DNA_ORIENTATION=+